jgi:hypothetical protein
MFCEKCNGAIAPGGEIGDSSKKLLSNKRQILKIKSPFRGVYWGRGECTLLYQGNGWVCTFTMLNIYWGYC